MPVIFYDKGHVIFTMVMIFRDKGHVTLQCP